MNVVTTINNPYFNIANVSLNIITGNEKNLKIYGNLILNKDISDIINFSPIIVLDVINNDDNIVYHECVEPFKDSISNNASNSFVVYVKDYQRFFDLDNIKEFKIYTILRKNQTHYVENVSIIRRFPL